MSGEDGAQGRVRVAMIAPGEVFGGAERQLLYLMDHLRRDRHRCVLICFHDSEMARRTRELGIPVLVLKARPLVSWSNARQIAALLRSEQIHVVHVHGYKAAAHALLARLLVSFRVMKTEHGKLEISAHGSIADLKPRMFRAIENAASRIPKIYVLAARRSTHVSRLMS